MQIRDGNKNDDDQSLQDIVKRFRMKRAQLAKLEADITASAVNEKEVDRARLLKIYKRSQKRIKKRLAQ